jgi:hypothetical protein
MRRRQADRVVKAGRVLLHNLLDRSACEDGTPLEQRYALNELRAHADHLRPLPLPPTFASEAARSSP